MITCRRWYHLTKQYATYRTSQQTYWDPSVHPHHSRVMIRHRRQLSSPLELLQAYENVLGIPHEPQQQPTTTGTVLRPKPQYQAHVLIPILLPSHQPLRVTDCGDEDYNGIYYCTGCNGNGYIFTKPRPTTTSTTPTTRRTIRTGSDRNTNRHSHHSTTRHYLDMADSDDIEIHGQPLRCIIARRFSNEVRNMTSLVYGS